MSSQKKTAVMYGAGNIGRGFIGQVFHDSGFEVVFIDINEKVVSALNKRGAYTQLIIDENSVEEREICFIRAVDGRNRDAVIHEIAVCDILAVSVGAAVLPRIAPLLADGLVQREKTLNILVCENLVHAPDVLRGLVSDYLPDSSMPGRVGFVGATIGRMVPVIPPEQRDNDPTLIAVERFCLLPVDGDAVISPMPVLKHTILCSPFAFEEGKKLYIHNMGHSLAAYLGALKGFDFIWQIMDDKALLSTVQGAMGASADALAQKYSEDRDDLSRYVDDLLSRFGNKGLGDTVARVGGDPLRKLAPGDRFMGTVDLCKEQGVDYSPVLSGISAALRFDAPDDPSAGLLRKMLEENGVSAFLRNYCGLSEEDATRCL